MKALREPGWWTVAVLILSLVCNAVAFRYLTEYRLAEIQASLNRLETAVQEQDRKVSDQDKRLMRLEWEQDLERSVDELAREKGRPTTVRPPLRTREDR